MRNAVRILKTGLLHVGFKNFGLLHRFEEEVNLVLDKSLIQGSMDTFVNWLLNAAQQSRNTKRRYSRTVAHRADDVFELSLRTAQYSN